MGVHSFWDIVGPTAKPVRLESLQDRRMAVDASIWIYQFLKAVRDQEGNALKNSHIVGFFRRICKLLYFGIRPVFVFDGGVPALKRSTIQQRKERRQGKRDNATVTARKLLAIQLQKKQASNGSKVVEEGADNEKQTSELFKPQDEWHLPVIPGFQYDKDDQRVVSAETFEQLVNNVDDELENIDLDSINPASAEFEELPKSTQYLILSTLRLKSRLRMGYTRDQLEELFPNSMDFSRFQIDMVKRRNFFTQKLMGVTGLHDGGASKLDDEVAKRVSGQMNKEYKLTKSDNGWTLGLGDLDGSETQKAIILDDKDMEAVNYLQKRKRLQHDHGTTSTECKSKGLVDGEEDEEDDDLEWEDVDVKPKKLQKQVDYSINAARLPKLEKEVSSVGSRSFLDRRHDQASPLKRPFSTVAHQIEEKDDEKQESANYDEDSDDEYQKQLDEIKLIEATQRSVNASSNQRKDSLAQAKINGMEPKNLGSIIKEDHGLVDKPRKDHDEPTKKVRGASDLQPPTVPRQPQLNKKKEAEKPPASETRLVPLTESEQNLQHIVSKIPEFSFNGQNSFLFQDSSPRPTDTEEEDTAKGDQPVQEMPAWFSGSDVQQNPYSTSNFVQDQETTPANNHSDKYALLSGPGAQELLERENNQKDDIEVIEVTSDPGEQRGADESEKSQTKGDNDGRSREALAYDYDFSEEEEENIAENLRKEQLDFATFKNTINNRVIDNAFMEDELFEQQVKDKRDSDEVTTDMIVEVQDLLSRFGIPFITAPMEAEAQCAELLNLKLVDGIITDDSDVFLFGGSKVYKNMFHEKNYVEFYDYQSIRQNLGLDRDNMIELAQLLGSDYTNGIKGMGPVSSMEVLAEFGSLVKFRDWYNEGQFDTKKQKQESKFEKDLRKRLVKSEVVLGSEFPSELVRDAYIRPEVDHDKTAFTWGSPDLDMLRQYLRVRVGWPQEKSDEILVPLIRDINNRKKQTKQRTLTEFFPSEYMLEKKLNFGKRLTTASTKLKKRKMK